MSEGNVTMMPGELSMEAIKERLDWLEARVTENEGDADKTGIYWDELRHLRQVYDRMIMDSQGKGIQMMQDIMDKQPETRDNYTVGVPTADSQAEVHPGPVPHAEPDGDEGHAPAPAVNLTINVNGDKSMEPNVDVSLMRSQGDVRIPLNLQVPLEKARKARKEKEASIDGIDQDKIDAADAAKKKKKDEEEGETPETEKSFRRVETETLQKSLLSRRSSTSTVTSMCGSWAHRALKKSQSVDDVALAIKTVLQKAGAALVMGVKAPASAEAKKSAYAEIVALNCEIQRLQEKLQDSAEPDENVKLNNALRAVYEKLAVAIMHSEGLGLKTEDMVVNKPDTRFPDKMTENAVGKGQNDDLTKSKHYTGKLPGGAKFAMTVWDAEGGLDEEQESAVIVHVASTDKAIAKRLAAKLPPLPKMKDVRHVIGGDQDAPIDKKHAKAAKGKHPHEHKPSGQRAGYGEVPEKKAHSDNGNHYGQMKHVVRRSGKK